MQNYEAAGINRMTVDWPTQIMSPTTALRAGLRTMRARSRDLEKNNDYARRFFWMVRTNVGGPGGIQLQSDITYPRGNPDTAANDKIEKGWEEWNKKGNFDVTGQMNGIETDGMVPATVARDGELLVRVIEGFDNDWGFALQFFEADYLDETLNVAKLRNGNTIRMGVEFNRYFRPVAYHLLADHPGDGFWTYNSRTYTRVPAEQMIHLFMMERFNQPRGIPWMHTAMVRLNNIGAYEEAEIMGARIGASDMGFLIPGENADPEAPVNAADAVDKKGNPIMDYEPGTLRKLPMGWDVKTVDPKHPGGNFAPFLKASLRGCASGLLVSYNSLANDLEGVNYSSLRSGALEERDSWRIFQAWITANYKREVYRRWLRMALLTQKVRLPASGFDRFYKPKFVPRTWDWVDPVKDVASAVTEIDNGLTTKTDVLKQKGKSYEDLLRTIKREEELEAEYGVKPKPPVAPPPAKPDPGKEGDDTDEDETDEEREEREEREEARNAIKALVAGQTQMNQALLLLAKDAGVPVPAASRNETRYEHHVIARQAAEPGAITNSPPAKKPKKGNGRQARSSAPGNGA